VTKPEEKLLRCGWHRGVTRGGCVMCRAFPLSREQRAGREIDIARIEGHHVLAKRHLRTHNLESRFWDQRNGIALCSYHHHRHEWALQRVPYGLLPACAIEFASEVELLSKLEMEYA
jgi:hypothetical protein